MLPDYILFPILSVYALFLVVVFIFFRGYRHEAQSEGNFEGRWLDEIERQRKHIFILFRGSINFPKSPITPTKIQKYAEEVRWYLEWSHWTQRLLCFGGATFLLLLQSNYGLTVAALDQRFATELSYPLEHSPPYSPSSIQAIEIELEYQLELKSQFDSAQAQAAEQGWILSFSAPYNEADLPPLLAQIHFNERVKPLVREIEAEYGLTLNPPYGQDLESLPLMLKTARIPKGTVKLWDGSLGHINRVFDMMAFEVTQVLYEQLMKSNPSARQCLSCPVERVSWKDAVLFANALSKAQGLEECYQIEGSSVAWSTGISCMGWRLPTEVEWVFAARGGQTESVTPLQQSVSIVDSYTSIGSKAPNDYGTFDQLGNVAEWVWGSKGVALTTSHNTKLTLILDRREPLEMIFCGGSARQASSSIGFNTRRPEYWFNVGDGLGFRLVKTVSLKELL